MKLKPVAVIPVKPRHAAKSRLSQALDERARAALSDRLLGRVLEAVRRAGIDAIVVSRDAVVRNAAATAAAYAVDEPMAGGLNAALDAGRAAAIELGATALLVLPGDLPDVTPEDVRALMAALPAAPSVVIAPDEAGSGTNALLLSPPDAIPFCFGAGSFALHHAAAHAAGIEPVVVRRPGLAFDVDTPDHLNRLAW